MVKNVGVPLGLRVFGQQAAHFHYKVYCENLHQSELGEVIIESLKLNNNPINTQYLLFQSNATHGPFNGVDNFNNRGLEASTWQLTQQV